MSIAPRGRLRRSRAVLSVLALSGVAVSLAACSSSTPSNAGGAPSGTIHVLVSSADASDAAFRTLNKDFEAKYPKVKVDFATVSNTDYPAAESSRLTANNVDVLVVKPVQVPSYAKGSESNDSKLAASGAFVDLTNESFMKRFTPSVLDSIAFDKKQYTVPTGLSYETGVYYNKDLFKKYGIAVPTTWQEFLQASATLKSKGQTPVGIGGKDSWPAGLPMLAAVQGAYPTTDAKDALAKGLWDQSVKLTDTTPAEVLARTQTVFDNAQRSFAGTPYTSIPGEFANQQFAMTVDGSWDSPTILQAVGKKFSVGYFPLPTSDDASANKFLTGKVELRLAVPTSTQNKTAAMAYLDFFSTPTEYAKFVSEAGFAPAQPGIGTSDFLKSIEGYTSTFVPAWDQVWTANNKAGNAALFPFNYTALSPLGTSDASKAAQSAQTAWSAAF